VKNIKYIFLTLLSTSIFSTAANADCFLGICGGGEIIHFPTDQEIYDSANHMYNEGLNVMSLGEIGRRRDEVDAQNANNIAAINAANQRQMNSQAIANTQQTIARLQNYAFNLNNQITQLSQVQKSLGEWTNLVFTMVNSYEEAVHILIKIKMNNENQSEILSRASNDYQIMMSYTMNSQMNLNSDVQTTQFLNMVIERANQYSISSSQYLSLILSKGASGEGDAKSSYNIASTALLNAITRSSKNINNIIYQANIQLNQTQYDIQMQNNQIRQLQMY
jgi:hypothetical protein